MLKYLLPLGLFVVMLGFLLAGLKLDPRKKIRGQATFFTKKGVRPLKINHKY